MGGTDILNLERKSLFDSALDRPFRRAHLILLETLQYPTYALKRDYLQVQAHKAEGLQMREISSCQMNDLLLLSIIKKVVEVLLYIQNEW